MAAKRFEYQHKDIPFLKKDIRYRLIFSALFLLTFCWQLMNIIMAQSANALDKLEIIIGAVTMVFCLMFTCVALLYSMQDIKTINKINRTGKSVKNVTLLSTTKKDSLIRMYAFISDIITIIMLIILASAVTYSVLQYIHSATVSYYLPALAMLTLSGFNGVWHMNNEIKLMKNVQEYNSIY